MTPPLGVKPMLVSIDRPAFSAVMLAPLPRCAMTRRSAAAQLPHDGLERQAVESVALDALRLQFFGNWQHPGDVGQTGMKLGVETRHLGHAGKVGLRQADERQRLRRVQRREGRSGLQLAQQRSVHQTMLAQGRPAVHDAVPNGVGWRHAGLCEHAGDALEGLRMLGRGDGLTELVTMLADVALVALQSRLESRGLRRDLAGQPGDAPDRIQRQLVAVQVVQHHHVERRRRGALFLVAPHMDVGVVAPPVGQLVNDRRVAVEREDHRLVCREQRIERVIRQPVRMF